jgi:hypothetical protein
MPNEYPLPDDLRNLIEKRGGKDRRKKTPGRDSDEDDRVIDGVRRPASQRDRRQQKNFRDLLNQDDDD